MHIDRPRITAYVYKTDNQMGLQMRYFPEVQTLWLRCDCHTSEHNVIIEYHDDEMDVGGFLSVEVTMPRNPSFWQRLWYAAKYVAGVDHPRDWFYASTMLDEESIQRLEAFLRQFRSDQEAFKTDPENYKPGRGFCA